MILHQLPSMTILFWFRKSESKHQNDPPDPQGSIQCRIAIEGNTLELGSTKVTCRKSMWDSENQTISGSNVISRNANRRLMEISTRLLRLFDILSAQNEFVSVQLVKDYYHNNRKFNYSIDEIRQAYFVYRSTLVEQKIVTASTHGVNKNYARHILDYAEQMKFVMPNHLPSTFFEDLYQFLLATDRCGLRMARKVACFAKQMLKWAVKKSLCKRLSCFDEDMPGVAESEDFIDTTHLTINQLEKLYHFDFYKLVDSGQITSQSAYTLSQERNAFVFNCFTGMHHCDYTDKAFMIEEMYGALFLKGKRKKTKKPFAIKLLEPALQILAKYDNDLLKLPVKSNQKRNDTLKLIALYVKIPLRLSTKIARKTFCDLALNEMLMPSDDIAACLGLTSTKYLKNYGRVRERRLLKVMKSWDELKVAS